MGMEINIDPVSLDNLGRGEVIDRFDEAFTSLLKNIRDPRTPHSKPREIAIKVKVEPIGSERNMANMTVDVITKFSAAAPFMSRIRLEEVPGGHVEAHEEINVDDQLGLGLENVSFTVVTLTGGAAQSEGSHDNPENHDDIDNI